MTDIKPENLLIRHDDVLKLCDFGQCALLMLFVYCDCNITYLRRRTYLIHSPTHSFPDIVRRSAFTRTAMQSLDKQLWRSRISLSTRLRLYNTCILPIFLYGSECWAITKEDARRINALHQWLNFVCIIVNSYLL